MVKHRQLTPTVGPLTNDRQKNSMASLDDNPVLEKSTSFHVGSWIFVADGSGGFESHSTDQNPQKLQKPQNTVNSTNSSINSKKLHSRTSTTKPEFNPNSTQSKPKHSPNWKKTWKNCWKTPGKKLPLKERPHFPTASASPNQVSRRKSRRLA